MFHKGSDIVLFMTISITTSLVKLPRSARVDNYLLSNEILEKVFWDSSSLCLPNHLKCTSVSIYKKQFVFDQSFKNAFECQNYKERYLLKKKKKASNDLQYLFMRP